MPLLNPTFKQLDDGTELFSCRVKTGLWNGDFASVDNGGVFVVEAIERGGGESSSGTRRRKVQPVQQGTRQSTRVERQDENVTWAVSHPF